MFKREGWQRTIIIAKVDRFLQRTLANIIPHVSPACCHTNVYATKTFRGAHNSENISFRVLPNPTLFLTASDGHLKILG